MEQYISKSALVAEIEKLKEQDYPCDTFEESTGYYNALDEVSSIINTLVEVKSVDLDEEIEKCLKKHSMLAVGKKDFTDIAKHFYSLGLAQKGEEV